MRHAKTAAIYCNRCDTVRQHGIEPLPGEDRFVDGETFVEWRELCECRTCRDTKIRHVFYCSGRHQIGDDEILDDGQEYRYFPPIEKRRWPVHFNKCIQNEPALLDMAQEVYSALNNGLNRLTAIGCRAIVEYIFKTKVDQIAYGRWRNGDDTYGAKLAYLGSIGLLAKTDQLLLKSAVVDHGNNAAHRLAPVSDDEAGLAVAMAENLIQSFYEIRK